MTYVTIEVEIDHGKVLPMEPEKLPLAGRGLLTILPTASPSVREPQQLRAFQSLQRSLGLDEAKASTWLAAVREARRQDSRLRPPQRPRLSIPLRHRKPQPHSRRRARPQARPDRGNHGTHRIHGRATPREIPSSACSAYSVVSPLALRYLASLCFWRGASLRSTSRGRSLGCRLLRTVREGRGDFRVRRKQLRRDYRRNPHLFSWISGQPFPC